MRKAPGHRYVDVLEPVMLGGEYLAPAGSVKWSYLEYGRGSPALSPGNSPTHWGQATNGRPRLSSLRQWEAPSTLSTPQDDLVPASTSTPSATCSSRTHTQSSPLGHYGPVGPD